jgi:carboxypeptidase D
MRIQNLLSTAALAVSLCAENAHAVGHGRFGQRARGSSNMAKRTALASKEPQRSSHDNFRFLNDETKCMIPTLSPRVNADTNMVIDSLSRGELARCAL